MTMDLRQQHAAKKVRRRGLPPRSELAVLAAAILVCAGALTARAETRAVPFPAWPEPQVDAHISVDQAKAIVAARTKRQTEWSGPTSGPKATDQPVTIAWVSGDESTRPISAGAAA